MVAPRLRRAMLLGTALLAPLAAPALAEDAPPSPGAPGADADRRAADDSIVVTGLRAVTQASAGTKTDMPLVETPQSISVITAGDLSELGLQNLNQALRFVAGVTPETRGASAEVYDQFKLRGFDAPTYLDGLKLFGSATGYAVPQVDVSRIERIEIVKGPASALYGQSGPGGLVVEESKLPLDKAFYGNVAGTYGSYDLYRADADIGGRITDDVLWRLYGSANGAHDQQRYGRRERQTVSGAVTLGAQSSTSFTVLGNYSHDPRNGDYAVFPAVGTLIANPAGRISTHFYGGEPGDFFSREQASATYILRHEFGGGWAFRSSGRYQYVRSRLGIVYPGGYPVDTTRAAPTLFARSSYSTREQTNSWTYDNQLTGSFETGPLHHELLIGADRQVSHSAEVAAFGGGTPIDVFDPVYGTMPTPRTPDQVPASFGINAYDTHVRQQGVYGQDQLSLAGLRLTLSGRQDWARTASAGQVQHDSKFTYRVGGLYLLPSGLAPYASYSTSFEPQTTVLFDGSLPKPSLGTQIEAGLKYQPPGTRILVTGAWFHIIQSNVAQPDANFSYRQVGKVRSRGVEVEASAPLPLDFTGKVAFSRQRVVVLEDVVPANIGRGLATVGRGGVSANLEWAPKAGPLAGFAIGGAVRHVDPVYADVYLDGVARNTPSYTLADALLRYDLGALSPRLHDVGLQLNATNLFDKRYLTSCFTNYGWCWYGQRRTVQGTISYRW